MNNITKLTDSIKTHISEADKTYIKRHNKDGSNKLNFNKSLYSSIKMLHKSGASQVRNDLDCDNIVDISKNALIKNRKAGKTYQHIDRLNNFVLGQMYCPINNYFKPNNLRLNKDNKSFRRNNGKIDNTLYINRSNKRLVAVDGSNFNVDKTLVNGKTIKLSHNEAYGSVQMICCTDVINRIPLVFLPIESGETLKKSDERKGINDSLQYLDPTKDVLVFDRLYYSKKLAKTLKSQGFDFIFRVKNNSSHFENLAFSKSKLINIDGNELQIFKYKIGNEQYNILTSITEKMSIAEVKALYWLRWKIEIDFKKIKYDVLMSRIRSKNYNSFLVDIHCIKLVCMLASFIEYYGNKKTDHTYQIMSKSCLDILYNKILKEIFFKKTYKTETKRLIEIIYKNLVKIVSGRSYERIRAKPLGKQYPIKKKKK